LESGIIDVRRAISESNDALAAGLAAELAAAGVFALNVIGGAGAGKTSLIIRLAGLLKDLNLAVIEGDIASDIDTRTLRGLGVEAWQINTGGECHLNAAHIRAQLERHPIVGPTLLLIENIGNLVCPADFAIGEHAKLLVCSTAEGSDKPYKYPQAFRVAAAIAVTKTDLEALAGFGRAHFERGLRALNPAAPLFWTNARTGEGCAELAAWLRVRSGHQLPPPGGRIL
jgi:hydrogenase nickel incorporation protein HypB